jgi:hypothetical protein
MELALSVIGQMASRSMRLKSDEFWGGFAGAGVPEVS